MRTPRFLLFLTAACLAALTSFSAAQDPGSPDTVKITGGPLVVGQSIPISVTFVNDFDIPCYQLGLIITSPDSGFAHYDSAVYVNRMADPAVMGLRIEVPRDTNGISPDTIHLGGEKVLGYPIAPGNDPILLLYFTGLTPTTMTIDSGYIPPAGDFLLCNSNSGVYTPQFQGLTVEIQEGNPPPTITLPDTAPQVAAGASVSFDVSAVSPYGSPVTLSLVSFTGYDNESLTPTNNPTLGTGNPTEFEWQTTTGDVGIWLATFEACDTAGTCATRSIDVQVVSSPQFLVLFDRQEFPCGIYPATIAHGNFDSDPASELVFGGSAVANGVSLALYDPGSSGDFTEVYNIDDSRPKFGLQTGFFDLDEYLDVIVMGYPGILDYRTMVFHGTGDNSFSAPDVMSDGRVTRVGITGEFTGDSYLDYAVTWQRGIYIYAGDSLGDFSYATMISSSYQTLTINSADFDGNGTDDMAVGTEQGVTIYLQTSPGVFTSGYSYNQIYGSLDIEVTNKGSDFNDDDIFDLCISTPSVGGTISNMMAYLGLGDGSFARHTVRTVKGQIFGNCVGDFNGDGELDIAYVNGAREYTAVLFGDGDGEFTNELRYPIPHYNPQFIDCYDVDLDGDVDIVVMANEYDNGRLYLLKNESNPGGYSTHAVSIAAHDNAEIELASASGKTFNRVRNTMPSGDYYRRNLEDNGNLDDYATTQVVEDGAYTLTVAPKPNLPEMQPFSLMYSVDGQNFRLADQAPMQSEGYRFAVSLTGASNVSPRSGSFIQANPPSFAWQGEGEFDFQLASDIAFSDIMVNTTVSDNFFSLESPLPVTDTALYYWRVKPHGAPDYDFLYAVNIVSGGAAVCGDITGNGNVDIGDAVYLVNFIFKGGPAPDPFETADVNCDGRVNIGDAVYYIHYIFRGGPPPCCQ